MLWEKESTKKDALYLDMFDLVGGDSVLSNAFDAIRCQSKGLTFNKDDAVSLQKRKEGNQHFGQGNWNDAMELYNASLRYAKNGSQNISLAYANRSACFMKMKRFNESLVDVELAKNAGYPDDLMPKLDRRKEECMKLIEEGVAACSEFDSKLSFEPNEKFPCMAKVLKVDRDAEGNVGLFATEDITIGQTIVVEKAFIAYVYSRYGWKCNICLKEYANFFPCKKCTVALFCDKCRGNTLHDYECGLQFSEEHNINGMVMRTVRSGLLAIDIFPNIEDLMKFVERVVKADRNQLPANTSNAKSQYEVFLKLPVKTSPMQLEDVNYVVFEAFKILSNIPKMKNVFKQEKYRRFFMHLISHQFLALEMNSSIASTETSSRSFATPWASSTTGLMVGYLKHSCAPNVLASTFHGNMVITTVRPIKKGEEVMHSLLLRLLRMSNDQRKQFLWQERKMICKCARCEGAAASLVQRKRMSLDPDFKYITANQSTIFTRGDGKAIQTMMEKCKHILQKYGQINWCDEVGNIVETYIQLIYFQFRGITSTEIAMQTN